MGAGSGAGWFIGAPSPIPRREPPGNELGCSMPSADIPIPRVLVDVPVGVTAAVAGAAVAISLGTTRIAINT